MGAIINLPENKIEWSKCGKSSTMQQLPSGHITVNIMEFADGGWCPPSENTKVSEPNTRVNEPLSQTARAEPM
eukprot:4328821-Amphidinium_carterae.1